MKNRTLVLTSGGPDCMVAAGLLKTQGHDVHLLHFQYGQQASRKEKEAAADCATALHTGIHVLDIGDGFRSIKSALLSPGIPAKEMAGTEAFVPARNLIFLSIAAGIAGSWDYTYLAIGNIADGIYPDNKPAFVEQFDQMLKCSFSPDTHIRAIAPINHFTKASVIKLGSGLGIPLHLTWSCYKDGKIHCGECASCLGRRKAFIAAGVVDPTQYAVDMPSALP